MTIPNSTLFIILIGFGAICVALGNIYFNLARESENKIAMANQALKLIEPELKRNQKYLPERIKDVQTFLDPNPPFETAAWDTVSNSQIITGIEEDKLTELLEVYYQMNNANALHARYTDLIINQDINNPKYEKTKILLQGNLQKHYERIQGQLKSLLSFVK